MSKHNEGDLYYDQNSNNNNNNNNNNGGVTSVDVSTGVVDVEQLQLIQLCFGEHEFGVALDNDMGDDSQANNEDMELDHHYQYQQEKKKKEQEEDQNGDLIAFDFDPVKFVQEKLDHGVPLLSLCRDLETYTNFLNNSILRHVNTDMHDAFVKVSGHLVGMQDELRCVQQPVLASVKKVENAMSKLDELEQMVNSQIMEASKIELARLFDVAFLKLLLLYDLLHERLEALPLCLRPSNDEKQQQQQQHQHQQQEQHGVGSMYRTTTSINSNNNNNKCTPKAIALAAGSTHVSELLLDIAVTLQELKDLFHVLPQLSSRVKEREEASDILRDGTQLSHQVFERVYLALYEDYVQNPREELTQTLRTVMKVYYTAGEVQEFCRMYRERIIRPLLESVLSWRAATQARHSLEDTIKLLNTLREQLETNVLRFVPILHEAFEGTIMPVPMIIWPTVCEALVKKMVSLYDVGMPDAFQQRYMTAHKLLTLMEENCSSSEELRALMQSPDVALWKHKWNTDVYATMRSNELAKIVDEATKTLNATPLEQLAQQQQQQKQEEPKETHMNSTISNIHFHLEPFMKLREALDWLFSPGTYIFTVTPKFLREAANATRRVAQSVLAYSETAQNSSSMENWLSVVMSATADLEIMAKYIEGPFRLRLQEASGKEFENSSPVLLLLSQDTCRGCASALYRLVQLRVAEECTVGLQNIRSVKSAYSHMRKPLPTAASWFVPSIIEPLQRFSNTAGLVLTPNVHTTMMIAVVEEVCGRFRAIAKETLITAKKTEESWEKLRRRKEITAGGRGTSADGMGGDSSMAHNNNNSNSNSNTTSMRPRSETASDRDKMTVQLYLDAKALIEGVQPLLPSDVRVDQLSSVVALLKLLRRANWILGEDIPEPPDIDEHEV